MRVSCLIALGVLVVALTDALQSCAKNEQIQVPCLDELLLNKSDKLLLTLFGHSCYTMSIVSPLPLEVQFFESRELVKSANSNQSGRRRQEEETMNETNETVNSLAALRKTGDCRNVLSCVQLQKGLSRSTMYNLMISRWANGSDENEAEMDQEKGVVRVIVQLEHCDPVSPWHYVGLVIVGGIGFTSTMLLFCIIGEVKLGLRTTTKVQNAARRGQFVELAQVDPLRQEKEVETKHDDLEAPPAVLMTAAIPTESQQSAEIRVSI